MIDSKKILEREKIKEDRQKKIDLMFHHKHQLFDHIHHRLRLLGKTHTSQKLGWYKRRWGFEIKQFYFTESGEVLGDLDRITKKLCDEMDRVRNLSNKDFKIMFGHKVPKYKQRIEREMLRERTDDNVFQYRSPPKYLE
tara:strand:- start:86 stop:502 length:417 start_codon:yes stop_codon:yes gene_type:complete